MSRRVYHKQLSANDVGATGAHQAGIHVPKADLDLIEFFPVLNKNQKNPSVWITCRDEYGIPESFRFIHYNNRLHDPNGTRDEYRLTNMTKWIRRVGAQVGDIFEIQALIGSCEYRISLIKKQKTVRESHIEQTQRVKLSGWRRIH